jgi:hypothetical protein
VGFKRSDSGWEGEEGWKDRLDGSEGGELRPWRK